MLMRESNDEQRMVALRFAHVAMPDHTADCEPWEWSMGAWTRLFTVREWQVAGVLVSVSGEQTQYGQVRHWVYVGGEEQLTVPEHRQLVEALTAAGDLCDSLG